MRFPTLVLAWLLLFSGTAFASGVSDVVVDPPAPSSATGARTVYRVSFTTSPAGALAGADTVRVTLPGDAGASAWQGGTLRDATRDIGSCALPNAQLTSTCTLFSGQTVAAGARLTVTLRGVTNPATPGQRTLGVVTTRDADLVTSPTFGIVAGGQVTSPTVAIDDPTAATGALTRYVIGFSVSSTGGLSDEASSRITVTLPPGTGADAWQSGTIRAGGSDVGSCSRPDAGVADCRFFSGRSVAAGTALQLVLRGLTNGPAGSKTLTVATTSDLPARTSSAFEVTAGGSVTTAAVTIAQPSAAAGAVTRYLVGFGVTGGLSADAGSRLFVTLPAGTGVDAWQSGTVRVGTSDVGSCGRPVNGVSECGLFSGAAIAGGSSVQLILRGLINGDPGPKTVSVRTSTDLPAVESAAFDVLDPQRITAPTVAIADPSAAAGAQTRYEIGFSVSSTGGLSAEAGSRIAVTLPPDTTAPGWQSGTVRDLTRGVDVGSCGVPAGGVSTCGLFSGQVVNPGDTLRLTLRGLTNGDAGAKTVSVTTTSDREAVGSAPFTVVPGAAVTPPTLAFTPSAAAGARTQAVIGFRVSATGGLSADAGSQLTVTLPPGTGTERWLSGTVRDVTRNADVGSCTAPAGGVVRCGLFSSRFVNAGDELQLTLRGLTTGPAGAQTVSLTTTSDRPAVRSSAAVVSAASRLSDVAVRAGTLTAGAATDYAVHVTTSSAGGLAADAGSEIRLTFPAGTGFGNGAATVHAGTRLVGACSAPDGLELACALNSGQLVAGGATLRIVVPAVTNPATPGTLSAVTSSDTLAAGSGPYGLQDGGDPTPTPTPPPKPSPTATATAEPTVTPPPQVTPAPTPTATPNAQPTRGTVKVKRPGSGAYVELDATRGVPLGSTVDAKNGAVKLTTPSGAAEFSDGIFRLSRSGSVTVLTLVEPLACPTKGKASAARKKAKTRKLWGKGKGSFRTAGRYSAATVRGTTWLVQDTCTTTLTRVTEGTVTVRDTVKKKTVVVRAGKRYTARKKR